MDLIYSIEIEHLMKRYEPTRSPAVEDLSLVVSPGEVYGLLGPNGSGKSTTIGVVSTLLAATSGTVRVAGHDVASDADNVRRVLGTALQEAGVDPQATGRTLLELHAQLLGASRRDARGQARQLLATFDLEPVGDRPIRTYSGGTRRRLDLAAALVGAPKVVVLDEPTTGLDPISRRALWAVVDQIRDRGVAVLMTTQYLDEADRLADRVGIIVEGRLVAEGSPDELKRSIGGDVVLLEVAPDVAALTADLVQGRAEGEGRVSVAVDDGGAALPRLLDVLRDEGVTPSRIAISQPSLDDVVLHLAGTRLTQGVAA